MVVLKRLADAIGDGDNVRAVIRGSAVNHNGRTAGITVPSTRAQQELIREALDRSGVTPSEVAYLEAHGTGTSLGDPIEFRAAYSSLAGARSPDAPLWLGSVKTNLGHLEAAAGIAGLIKVILSIEHRLIPPHLHLKTLNPHLPSVDGRISIPRELVPWAGRRLAGVSSFGISGTNAHVIIDEPPASLPEDPGDDARVFLMAVSARSPAALTSNARDYAAAIAASDEALSDICHTAAVRRNHHEIRLGVLGRTRDEIAHRLAAVADERSAGGATEERLVPADERKIVFLFPGQGTQWVGMGSGLLNGRFPEFANALSDCDAAIARHTGWSVLDVIRDPSPARLERVDVVQPTIFAVQVALARLWQSWGIQPDAVVGHSLGEIAASVIAGGLDLNDGARVISVRSRLVRAASNKGGMVVAELSESEADALLADQGLALSVAAVNGPRSIILAGEEGAIRQIAADLEAKQVFCRRIDVEYASHCAQMDPLLPQLRAELADLEPQRWEVPFHSTVLGTARTALKVDATYWADNLRRPVLFWPVMRDLVGSGHDVFLEISPHPVLLDSIADGLGDLGRRGICLPSLRKGSSEEETILSSLATAYATGFDIDWRKVYPEGGCVPLPTYRWQKDVQLVPHADQTSGDGVASIEVAKDGTRLWQKQFNEYSDPAYFGHRVYERPILPLSAVVDCMMAAVAHLAPSGWLRLSELRLHRSLPLPAGFEQAKIQCTLSMSDAKHGVVQLHAREKQGWQLVAETTLTTSEQSYDTEPSRGSYPEIAAASDASRISGAEFYERTRLRGVGYDVKLRLVESLRLDRNSAIGDLMRHSGPGKPNRLGWLAIEAAVQVAAALANSQLASEEDELLLPTRVGRLSVREPGSVPTCVHAMASQAGKDNPDRVLIDVRLIGNDGTSLAELEGLCFERAEGAVADDPKGWVYETTWQEAPGDAPSRVHDPRCWLILADARGVGEELAHSLEQTGDRCVLLTPGDSFARLGPSRCVVRPGAASDFTSAMKIASEMQLSLAGIIHLWSLDTPGADDTTVATLQRDVRTGCSSVISAVQALIAEDGTDEPRLWLVTCNSQAVTGQESNLRLGASHIWGLGRALMQEHRECGARLLDLDDSLTVSKAAQIVHDELHRSGDESQVAVRSDARLVPRLTRALSAQSSEPPHQPRADGAYLIVGGWGDLGLALCRRLIARGARRLILVGRSKFPPRGEWSSLAVGSSMSQRIESIRALESMGASVQIESIDVADGAALRCFLERYRNEGWPAIRGVVHAAAEIRDKLLHQTTVSDLDAVFRSKVSGAWELHRAFSGQKLDFFVLFSSASALLPMPGQASYAAANCFLGALAHHRRSCGLSAIALNWSGWQAQGVALSVGGRRTLEYLRRQGIRELPVNEALELFSALKDAAQPELTILRVKDDHEIDGKSILRSSSLFCSHLTGTPKQGGESAPRHALSSQLAAAVSRNERYDILQNVVVDTFAHVLRRDAARIDPNTPMRDLGIDSLMAMELRNGLEKDTGVRLSATVMWAYPTLATLTSHLLTRVERSLQIPSDEPPAEFSAKIDEDLAAILSEAERLPDDDCQASDD